MFVVQAHENSQSTLTLHLMNGWIFKSIYSEETLDTENDFFSF